MRRPGTWLWFILLTLLWPGLHWLVFLIRFGTVPQGDFKNVLVFLPMGLVSASIFLILWRLVRTQAQKTGIIIGYLVASPIAFMLSLLSGLVPPLFGGRYYPVDGIVLYGVTPLAAGMLLGLLVGSIITRIGSASSQPQQKGDAA